MGSNDGGGVGAGVAAGAAGAAGAAVVGVIVGGASAEPSTSGGGFVGAIREDPKMLTSICCAAGWSATRTSPRSENADESSVGSVCDTRSFPSNEW